MCTVYVMPNRVGVSRWCRNDCAYRPDLPGTGIWKAQGHNVRGVMVQQGERMPEVFAPDRSGAYRFQPALWEFERKVSFTDEVTKPHA